MTEHHRRNEPGRNSYPPTQPNDDPPGQESRQRTDTEGGNGKQLCWLQPRPPPSPQQQYYEQHQAQPAAWPLNNHPPTPSFTSASASSFATDNDGGMMHSDGYSQQPQQQQCPQQQYQHPQHEYVFPYQWTPHSPQSFEQYTVQPLQQQPQQWPEERATHNTTILEAALHGMQQRSQQLRTELGDEDASMTKCRVDGSIAMTSAFSSFSDVETTTDRKNIDNMNTTRMATAGFKNEKTNTQQRVRLVSSNTTTSTAIAATSSVAAAAKKKRNIEKQRRDDLNYQYTSLIRLVTRIEADDAYRKHQHQRQQQQQQQQQQRTLADSHQKQNEKNEAVEANTQAQNAVEHKTATTVTITKQCARATVRAATAPARHHDVPRNFSAVWSPISAANRADVLARTVQQLRTLGAVYQQQHARVQALRHQLHSLTSQTQTAIEKLHSFEQNAVSSAHTSAALMAMRTQQLQLPYPRVPAWMGPTLLLLPHHPYPPPLAFPTAATAPTGTVPTFPAPYLLLPVPVPTMPTNQFQTTMLVSTAAAATTAPLGVPPVQGVAVAADTETVSPTTHTRRNPKWERKAVGRTPDDDTSSNT